MEPPQPAVWQYGVAVVLGALLLGACGQLALVANVSKLPKETLEFFSNPDNLNSNLLPPGLDTWDPAPYLLSALPIAVSNVGWALASCGSCGWGRVACSPGCRQLRSQSMGGLPAVQAAARAALAAPCCQVLEAARCRAPRCRWAST
jgi:hypothetical protein